VVGKNDSTEDMRPGLGWDGLAKLQKFVHNGGLLITATDTSQFALSIGMLEGVSAARSDKMKIVGAVLGARVVDSSSPIAYGYGEEGLMYCGKGPRFSLKSILRGGGGRRAWGENVPPPTG